MLRNEIVGSRSARHSNTTTVSNKVLVAVKAERVISNTALAWALTHVVHSSDSITLLAVYSAEKTGRRFWSFSKLTGDCSSSREGKLPERISDISESCSQMILQLQNQIEFLNNAFRLLLKFLTFLTFSSEETTFLLD
ncbi:hypothetical protein TanjilG_14673 [Lupinus angustifolius]|uniref:Uncharacterized protein n=1 Tax=Lupinus angustifolius TaxID=3871 RepID=A0A1J7GSD0_LUPAN|nr:hypothetical protein TanjilG_14673 [Lupinus angustifolius]